MIYSSPIGPLGIAFEDGRLTSLRPGAKGTEAAGGDLLVARWLDCYFGGGRPDFMPALAPRGTVFQLRVWRELMEIPYGQTVTYGELARRVGCRSAQAVGQAVARNPIAIIIPCHRVVAAGGLGGYAYGPDCKRYLLQLEDDKTLR